MPLAAPQGSAGKGKSLGPAEVQTLKTIPLQLRLLRLYNEGRQWYLPRLDGDSERGQKQKYPGGGIKEGLVANSTWEQKSKICGRHIAQRSPAHTAHLESHE